MYYHAEGKAADRKGGGLRYTVGATCSELVNNVQSKQERE